MKYVVQFQYKSPTSLRPEDCGQDEEFVFDDTQSNLIPNVGDSVTYLYGDKPTAFKVLTRHFSYMQGFCCINIVVSDIPSDEMCARLKE